MKKVFCKREVVTEEVATKRTGTLVRSLLGGGLATFLLLSVAQPVAVLGATFQPGDVFVAVAGGKAQWWRGGVLQATLDTGYGAAVLTAGMAFDSAGNLYLTSFNANKVAIFNTSGIKVGDFGSGYNADPESILFDALGHVYVGQADGSHHLLQFDTAGNLLHSFAPATEDRGTDWNDLASDEETMFYTSEGHNIKRFDVCTSTQLANFNLAALPGTAAYALRILPSGGVLVADTQVIVRLDAAGNQIQTYDAPGVNDWFALNLDPDGTSFWSATQDGDGVYKFDIATGALLTSFHTGAPVHAQAGLTVFGEITVSRLTCPADITQNNDPGVCGAIVTYPPPTVVGNSCTPVTVSSSPASGTLFPVGTTTVNITLTDNTTTQVVAQCSFTVTVVDNEPPKVTCPANVTVCNDPGVCSAVVSKIDPVYSDNCPGVTVAYVLSGATSGSGSGSASGLTFNKGVTTVTYTATDAAGLTSSCRFTVTVNDCEPPVVTCSVATGELWPPNHNLTGELTGVGFLATAVDNCDGTIPPSSINVGVFSDEDELAPASGNFSPDAKGLTATGTLRLRAERSGSGDGRVYLIVAKATDSSGNTGFCTSTVTVTHDQSAASIASVAAQAAAAQAYAAAHNGAPPPGYFVIGNGPIVGPKQ